MRILIAAGGTGGHINPGISVAEAVRQRWPESEIFFVCSKRDIEERIFSRKGFKFKKIDAVAIKKGVAAKFFFVFKFFLSIFESFNVLAGFRPEIVLGMGGYLSAPVVIAAKLMGIPTALHEQNRIPGKANALAARFASVVMIGFETAAESFPAGKTVFTGNPIRSGLLKSDAVTSYKWFGFSDNIFTILVVGGSQGAAGLNKAVVGALGILKDRGVPFQVIHMAGKSHDEVSDAYEKKGIRAHCETYFDDIGMAYVISDLVISRSGAITLAEITSFGKPAILIPYPYSADGHQKANARHLSDGGAAVLMEELVLKDEALADEIMKFYNDRERLKTFGRKSGKLAMKGVEEKILNTLNELVLLKRPIKNAGRR